MFQCILVSIKIQIIRIIAAIFKPGEITTVEQSDKQLVYLPKSLKTFVILKSVVKIC